MLEKLEDGATITVSLDGFLVGRVEDARDRRVYPLKLKLRAGQTLETYTDYGGSFCVPIGKEAVEWVEVRVGRTTTKRIDNPDRGKYLLIGAE